MKLSKMITEHLNDQGFPRHICDVHGNRIMQSQLQLQPQTPHPDSAPTNNLTNWRSLGKGNCGSVWTCATSPWAIKREDCSPNRFLFKEYYIQNRILSALSTIPNDVHIPYSFWYTSPPDEWRLAKVGMQACASMCSERIPPLSRMFRDRLVEHTVAERHVEAAKALDTDCIARVYLGKRRSGGHAAHYSLKNLPLWLNVLEDLDLAVTGYAAGMGEALALLHWCAEIDANDVEFVLGSPRQLSVLTATHADVSMVSKMRYNTSTRLNGIGIPEATQQLHVDEGSSDHTLWLLDFDCCDAITMDEIGATKAAVAVVRNDPYTPCPCSPDAAGYELWMTFRDAYLAKGAEIVELRGLQKDLPVLFIEKLEQMHKIKQERKELPKFHRGPFCAPLSSSTI